MTIYREHIVKRFTRSSNWSKVRKSFIKVFPTCCVCGKKKGLEVHHIVPFHINPDLELDYSNLRTMCRRHHFILGHLEYWKSYNIKIDECVRYYSELFWSRP